MADSGDKPAKKGRSSVLRNIGVQEGSSVGLIFAFLTARVSKVRTICSASVALMGKCGWDMRPIFNS